MSVKELLRIRVMKVNRGEKEMGQIRDVDYTLVMR